MSVMKTSPCKGGNGSSANRGACYKAIIVRDGHLPSFRKSRPPLRTYIAFRLRQLVHRETHPNERTQVSIDSLLHILGIVRSKLFAIADHGGPFGIFCIAGGSENGRKKRIFFATRFLPGRQPIHAERKWKHRRLGTLSE